MSLAVHECIVKKVSQFQHHLPEARIVLRSNVDSVTRLVESEDRMPSSSFLYPSNVVMAASCCIMRSL